MMKRFSTIGTLKAIVAKASANRREMFFLDSKGTLNLSKDQTKITNDFQVLHTSLFSQSEANKISFVLCGVVCALKIKLE
ncbi:hypothetical protein SLEP1_g44434 [Rubroshorea leprosula]|uniref:Uncharacterized protein n=1 Tax=Rubroshorea leprosula TaxID=152421 RepID=A0AAV5LGR1_9ROSI|nr:hypothetical protein SLEP1_g44434 [Rubroshorea leprosula]